MNRKRRELSVKGTERGLGLQFAREIAELGVAVRLTDVGEDAPVDQDTEATGEDVSTEDQEKNSDETP